MKKSIGCFGKKKVKKPRRSEGLQAFPTKRLTEQQNKIRDFWWPLKNRIILRSRQTDIIVFLVILV